MHDTGHRTDIVETWVEASFRNAKLASWSESERRVLMPLSAEQQDFVRRFYSSAQKKQNSRHLAEQAPLPEVLKHDLHQIEQLVQHFSEHLVKYWPS